MYRCAQNGSLVAIVTTVAVLALLFLLWRHSPNTVKEPPIVLHYDRNATSPQASTAKLEVSEPEDKPLTFSKRLDNCTFYSCFDVYTCKSIDEGHVGVYIHQFLNRSFADGFSHLERTYGIRTSREFVAILESVKRSKFNVERRSEACLHILPLDLMSELSLPASFGSLEFEQIVRENLWPFGSGTNHLFFNFVLAFNIERSRILNDLPLGSAMVISSSLNSRTLRPRFDVAIPFPFRDRNGPETRHFSEYSDDLFSDRHGNGSQLGGMLQQTADAMKRKTFILISQADLPVRLERFTSELLSNWSDVSLIRECESADAPNRNGGSPNEKEKQQDGLQNKEEAKACVDFRDIRQAYRDAVFCLLFRSNAHAFSEIPAMLESGCVPVLISNWYVAPLEELETEASHRRMAIHFLETEAHLRNAYSYLKSIARDTNELLALQRAGAEFVARFRSLDAIVNGALRILSNRVHPTRILSRLFEPESRDVAQSRTDL